jgi:uncharacterized protein YjgD (DUF1641 family)
MADQMDFIAAELQAQRESRERWSELTETLVPVTRGAVDMATRELEDLSPDVTAEDAARFARTAARALPKLEVLLAQLDSLSELLHTVNSLSGAGMDKLTEVLAVADDKGYFAFARQGGMIADRVVTEFTEEDVKALGDNVVTILNAVKEMTQPEVMGLVQRTAISVSDAEDTPIEPPSLFALLKSMRDPQTRRGLAKVMAMLHTVGEESAPASTQGRK